MAQTKTIYRATVDVTLAIYGPHSPAIVADIIAAVLPTDATTPEGAPITFGPVPRVVSDTPCVRKRRGWRQATRTTETKG